MYKLLLIIAALCAGIAPATFAAAETPHPLNAKMSEIGEVMAGLFPLIVAQRELSSPEQAQLKENLTRLVVLFREAGPHIRQRSETYNVSYQLVLDHLEKTKRMLDLKYLDQARIDLYALGPICTSCHTQDTQLRTTFGGVDRAGFPTDRAYAEFSYLTRNYAEAERYYDLYLRSDENKMEFDIVQPLQRLITIYTQVFNLPGTGAEKLSRYTDIKGHTAITRKHLTGWIKGLRALESSGASKVNAPDLKTIEGFIRQYIGPLDTPLPAVHVGPEQEIARVWLRGQLYHYLNRQPGTKEIPMLLYWLAVSDRAIGYEYFFSLADLYLKDCVLNYSSSPYAQRCFDEYNEYVAYAYSGSGGNFTPPEIEDELERLRAVLAATQPPKKKP